jgi:hypothetical protein
MKKVIKLKKEDYAVTHRFGGNYFLLIILLLFFWPLGIAYYFMNRKPVKIKIEMIKK